MEQRTAPTAEPASATRARAQRAVTVGEYVGERASVAVQALRRAGLKPALERSFGCAPDEIGGVIAQEPAAGAQLARNSMVALYVGAPGDEQTADRGEQVAEAAAGVVEAGRSLTDDRGRRRTLRKPGLAAATARPTDPPPSPDRGWRLDERDAPAEAAGAEGLVERAEALFAEGAGSRGTWRVRARRAGLGWGESPRRWRPSRRWVAVAVTLLLGVSLASAFGSRSDAGRSAINGVHRSGAAPSAREPVGLVRRKAEHLGTDARARAKRRAAHRGAARAAMSSRWRPAMGAAAAPRGAPHPVVTRAEPARSASPPPAPARSEGEFSP